MQHLASNVRKAKAFAVYPGRPVTFGERPKSVTRGQVTICFFDTEEEQLKIDSQKDVIDGLNQNMCIKSAGA